MKPWPHQDYAHDQVNLNIARGIKHMCLQSPTGGGKSVIMQRLMAQIAGEQGLNVALYSPRKMLTDQLIGYCESLDLPFGVRAATYDMYRNDTAPIQVCSPLTESARIKSGRYEDVPNSDVVFIDEAHMFTTGVNRDIINRHKSNGHIIVEVTATPIGMHDLCDGNLIVAGTTSELRKCGSLLPAMCYDHGTIDLKQVKIDAKTGELNKKQLTEVGFVKTIYASVIKEFKRLNPDKRPALMCAPGVQESKWFVDQFNREGIKSAHIDGDDIYVDGREFKKDFHAKEDLIARHAAGEIICLWNRFVLREGIDLPWLYYLGMCCPIGSSQSYIQTGGRVLRNHPSLDHVILADHGGNISRHGSINQDWDWGTLWKLNNQQIQDIRKERVREGKDDPGVACSKCGKMWAVLPEVCSCGNDMSRVYECYICGHKHKQWPNENHCVACHADMKRIRKKPVIQSDGSLKLVKDERYHKKKEQSLGEKTSRLWEGIYWSYTKHKVPKSFKQARAWFTKQHLEKFGCRPPQDGLKFMPKRPEDWARKVKDVNRKDLL